MNPFQYIRASSQRAAIAAIPKNGSAAFLAGGTNLIDLMKSGVTTPEKLVDINNLPMNTIVETATGVRIGALVKNSTLAEHPVIVKKYPLLSKALLAGASPQLRNMATVGGNMLQRTRCHYFYDVAMACNKRVPGSGCSAIGGYTRMHAIFGTSEKCIAVHPSDMCVALVALDATVIVAGPKGERKIPFADFHRLPGNEPQKDNTLLPGELITAVDLPVANFPTNTAYLKLRDRASYAFALISVAAAVQLDGNNLKTVRLSMGGVAHKPWRLREAELFLQGKPATEASFKAAAVLAMKGAKSFGDNDFKLDMAPAAIVEALKNAASKV